ncbi:MAG: serine hydrolase [Chloroflexota bacterium]
MDERLWQQVTDAFASVEGTFGLSYLHLNTGERYSFNGDETFYAASVIKLPVMCEVFRQVEYEGLDLAQKIVINRDDQVGGSGIINNLTPGTEMSLYDIMTLMIIQSDNSATNICIDVVGKPNTTRLMEKLGLHNIKLFNKLMIVPVEREGVNYMSPNDTTELLALIARGKCVSLRACEEMVKILKQQQFNDQLSKYIDLEVDRHVGSLPDVVFAHKTGWVNGTRNDAGIFYLPGQEYVLSVFSKGIKDDDAAVDVMGRVGKLIYDAVRNG